MSEVREAVAAHWIAVDDSSDGQRADNFLFSHLKGVPKSHIYRILRTGEIRRNGGRVRPQHRVHSGDLIRIPPLRMGFSEAPSAPSPEWGTRMLEQRVLFEDDDLLALNKPAGVPVHGGTHLSFGLIEGLRQARPDARFLELAHRLDRDTSGCLLIANRRSALRSLHEQFRDDRIRKVYTALLVGRWKNEHITITAPLEKNVLQSGERLVKISEEGKSAVTEFKHRQCFAAATLVEVLPLTGRTHQIRVHAKTLGHPIVGDDRYGSTAANQAFRKLGLSRMFLHATELVLTHPRTQAPLIIAAPYEAEFDRFLKLLTR